MMRERNSPALCHFWMCGGDTSRPVRHLPGRLHVMVVRHAMRERQVHDEKNGTRIVIDLEGSPGTQGSRARAARLCFVPPGQLIPSPNFDHRTGRMELYYPVSEVGAVLEVLHQGRERVCYLWQDRAGVRSLTWLMACEP